MMVQESQTTGTAQGLGCHGRCPGRGLLIIILCVRCPAAALTCSILALDARKLQLRPPSSAGLVCWPGLGDRCRMVMEGALAREKELLEGKEVKGRRSLRGEAGELLGAGAALSSNTMSVMEAGEVDLQLQ